jgi:restriction endonuclease S subunit
MTSATFNAFLKLVGVSMNSDIPQPTEWPLRPLGKCADVLDAKRKPVNSRERASRVGTTPYYGATGQVGWIDDYLFDEQLVLVGEDGAPFFDKTKPIAYVIDGKSWVNNHAHVLRARPDITTNRYLKYFLDSFDFTEYVQGSTRDKLTQGSMNSIPVPIAPREIQERLVEFVESVGKRRSSAVTHLASSRRAIEHLRQAVLVAACVGRLSEDWRQQHDDVTSVHGAIAENTVRQKRRANREQAVQLELTGLPDSYVISTIGEASTVLEYGTSQRCDATSGVPVLRMGNIQDGSLDLSDIKYCDPDEEIHRLLLQDGDLLFNRTNSPELVGKSAVFHEVGEMSFASYLIRVRFEPTIAVSDYVNYWLNSAWGRAWAQLAKTDGVSQSNINGSKLALMPIPLPPIAEQHVIVDQASAMLGVIERLLTRIDDAGRSVDLVSQAVLAKAFRGELIPR